MSQSCITDFICPRCFTEDKITVFTSITASINKDLKSTFLRGELNLIICKECKSRYKIETPILYHDSDNGFALWYAEDKKFVPEKPLSDNYLFNAKVINDWDTLILEILLSENKICSSY